MRNHLLNISTARTNMPGASKEYAPPKNKDRGKIQIIMKNYEKMHRLGESIQKNCIIENYNSRTIKRYF